MDKRIYWVIIFITLAVNVVMLARTIEAYYGLEYEIVFRNTIIGVVSSIIALVSYLGWRKAEYKK